MEGPRILKVEGSVRPMKVFTADLLYILERSSEGSKNESGSQRQVQFRAKEDMCSIVAQSNIILKVPIWLSVAQSKVNQEKNAMLRKHQ